MRYHQPTIIPERNPGFESKSVLCTQLKQLHADFKEKLRLTVDDNWVEDGCLDDFLEGFCSVTSNGDVEFDHRVASVGEQYRSMKGQRKSIDKSWLTIDKVNYR